jgi:hypothetical protein
VLEHAEPADMLTVKERLKKTGDEEVVGGFAYLAQIAENTPSVSNIQNINVFNIHNDCKKISSKACKTELNFKLNFI